MSHTDYTNLTDRIANRLVKAALAYAKPDEMAITRAGRIFGAPLHAAIERLARQVAAQGLLPADLDRPEGHDALFAVAAAVATKKTTAHFLSLPVEWKHVVDAAKRQIDLELQRAQR